MKYLYSRQRSHTVAALGDLNSLPNCRSSADDKHRCCRHHLYAYLERAQYLNCVSNSTFQYLLKYKIQEWNYFVSVQSKIQRGRRRRSRSRAINRLSVGLYTSPQDLSVLLVLNVANGKKLLKKSKFYIPLYSRQFSNSRSSSSK